MTRFGLLFLASATTAITALGQRPERNIEFKRGMEITVEKPDKPERERMSVGSSERSDRERTPSATTESAETPKPPAKLSSKSAASIQRINTIIKNAAAIKKFLIIGQLANLFQHPADALAAIGLSITSSEWASLAKAFNDLSTIENASIRNTIEETRFELTQELHEPNRDRSKDVQLRQELNFWENMDKALPATLTSKQRTSTVSDFQIFVSYDIFENGLKGIKIYPQFTISNALYSEGLVGIYFYNSDGTPLKDFNNTYNSSNGMVATYGSFSPSFRNSVYNKSEYNFGIFIPYDELHMASGKHTIYYRINIFDYDKAIYRSDWYSFQLTKP